MQVPGRRSEDRCREQGLSLPISFWDRWVGSGFHNIYPGPTRPGLNAKLSFPNNPTHRPLGREQLKGKRLGIVVASIPLRFGNRGLS